MSETTSDLIARDFREAGLGVANNVSPIVLALGGTAEQAKIMTAAAVEAHQFMNRWDDISRILGD